MDVISNTNLAVALYDLTGKKVQDVFAGRMTAGKQSVNVDLSNINTGLYFVTISADDNVKNS